MKMVSSNWLEQRIRIAGRMVFLPYYTSSPWGKQEEYFVFFSALPDFSRAWLHTWSPRRECMTAEFELVNWRGIRRELLSELLLWSVLIPERRLMVVPFPGKLFTVSVDTGEAVEVRGGFEPERIMVSGNLSRNGKYLVYGSCRFGAAVQERVGVTVFDAATFAEVGACEFHGFHAAHFQFIGDSEWLLFAHEGKTEGISDRLNRLNWRTGERQVLHRHETAPDGTLLECIGHEMTGGDTVCAVRYPVSRLPGALLTMRTDGSGYAALDCDDYWHCSCNASGTVFAMDTMWWGAAKRRTPGEMDIIRIDSRAGTKEIVKTIHSDSTVQYRHPHPQLNAAGDRLLFIENSDLEPNLASVTLRSMVR